MQKRKLSLVEASLFDEIRQMVEGACQRVASTVNTQLTLLYWQVGQRIHTEILKEKRAEYGKQIFKTLSISLTETYGRGWGVRHLSDCVQIARLIPDKDILHTLCAKLS